MARGLTIGPIVTAGVFVLLGLASVVTLVPGIMLFDAPGADRMPLTLAAGISSMLAPPAFFAGAAVLLLAGYFRRRRLVRIATIVPLVVLGDHGAQPHAAVHLVRGRSGQDRLPAALTSRSKPARAAVTRIGARRRCADAPSQPYGQRSRRQAGSRKAVVDAER